MKKKFFDKGLMFDGLSQLKLAGITLLIISLAATVLPAIFNWLNNIQLQKEMSQGIIKNFTINPLSISSLAPMLLPIMYIAPFIFCIILFAFLNNRKGSDFFHALSQTRICLFLSFTVSIIIWLAAIIIIPVLAASLIYVISGVALSAVFIPYVIFTLFAGSMLVLACMLFAMSITGTILSNIIVFGLIMFLPRLIISVYTMIISNSLPILNIRQVGQFANINYDIPSKFIASLANRSALGVATGDDIFTSILAIILTLSLAIIYIGIACLLFNIRKSEMAGNSAPNKVMQHVYRCAITLPLTLIIPFQIISFNSTNSNHMNFWTANAATIIAVIVVSLIIYYLFEIVTTKKIKNLLWATPFLLVIIIFDVVFSLSLTATRSNVLSFKPTTDQIQSVSIMPYAFNNYGSYNYSNQPISTYNNLLVSNIRFDNIDLLNDVTKTLSSNVGTLKSGSTNFYSNNGGQYGSYYVTFHLKNGKDVERYIYPSRIMASTLNGDMNENSKYVDEFTSLTPESTIKSISTASYVSNGLSKAQNSQLWNSFKKEYESSSLEVKREIQITYNQYINSNIPVSQEAFDGIVISGIIGTINYQQEYPITLITPKTAELYINMLNKIERAPALKIMTADFNAASSTNYYNITIYNDTAMAKISSVELNMNQSDSTQIANNKKVLHILLSQSDNAIDILEPFVSVSFNGFSYYQQISEKDIKNMQSISSAS